MNHFRRFGRTFPVPSGLQIAHELRAFSADENVRIRCAEKVGSPEAASREPNAAPRGTPIE